jgi:hypothetical protein
MSNGELISDKGQALVNQANESLKKVQQGEKCLSF